MGQVWPHSCPLAPSKVHTRAGRGEAAFEQRGRVEGERAGPREGWGVRPPPGGPLCPPLPGRAGAARVSGCDTPRAVSVTRAVSVLLGPKRPRNTPRQPPGASPASSRGLGFGQPQQGCGAAPTTSALCLLRSPLPWAGLDSGWAEGKAVPASGWRVWPESLGAAHSAGVLQSGAPAVSSGSRGGWAPRTGPVGSGAGRALSAPGQLPASGWVHTPSQGPGGPTTAGAQAISTPDYSHSP